MEATSLESAKVHLPFESAALRSRERERMREVPEKGILRASVELGVREIMGREKVFFHARNGF